MLKTIALTTILAMSVASAAVAADTESQNFPHFIDTHNNDWMRGLSAAQFCGGQLPAGNVDACGNREHQHGYGSCWRRLPYRPGDRAPRLRWICG